MRTDDYRRMLLVIFYDVDDYWSMFMTTDDCMLRLLLISDISDISDDICDDISDD